MAAERLINGDDLAGGGEQQSHGRLCGRCIVVMQVVHDDLRELGHEFGGFRRHSGEGDDQRAQDRAGDQVVT